MDRPATLPPAVVQIVGPADGWVLETLARVLARKLPYAEFVAWRPRPDGAAALAYYVNYALYDRPSGLIDVGFFTHRDNEFGFLDRARRIDCCVCMARVYADWLRERGGRDVVHIPMGFDSYRYRPSLVLGVVGKLDHPRKGRDLVERVRALPFVEVVATEGQMHETKLRDLYQRVDYVLIPATVEGGPMCLLEGLAMGKSVIAPEGVGMVPEFVDAPQVIRYRAGDAQALIDVVTDCYRAKRDQSAPVGARSWDRWAKDHHDLFVRLLRARGAAVPQPAPRFRFGKMRELDIPPGMEVGPLEEALDQAVAYLYYGRAVEAENLVRDIKARYPAIRQQLESLC